MRPRGFAILAPLAVVLAAAVGILLAGRSPAQHAVASSTAAPLRAVVTVAPLAGLLRPLLPQDASLTILMAPGRSEHGYEFTPTDLAALGSSDIAVHVGLGLEPQVADFLARNPGTRQIVVFADAVGIHGQAHNCEDHGHAHDPTHDHAAGVDPHLWLDPALVERLIPTLRDAVAKSLQSRAALTPQARAELDSRADELLRRVRALDADYRDRLRPFAGTAIVTHHAAFGRPAERYGLRVAEVIQRIESTESSPGELARVVDAIRRENVPAVFVEPQYNPAAAERIAKAAGVRLGRLDPLGTGDWFAMMNANLDELTQKLAPQPR